MEIQLKEKIKKNLNIKFINYIKKNKEMFDNKIFKIIEKVQLDEEVIKILSKEIFPEKDLMYFRIQHQKLSKECLIEYIQEKELKGPLTSIECSHIIKKQNVDENFVIKYYLNNIKPQNKNYFSQLIGEYGNISEETILKFGLNIKDFSKNKNLSEKFLEKYLNELDIIVLLSRRNLSLEFIEKNLEQFYNLENKEKVIKTLLKNKNLPEEFIKENFILNINKISSENCSISFEKNLFEILISHQKLSEKFFIEYSKELKTNLLFDEIFKYQKLSEEFIEKYAITIKSWNYVSEFQNLSEDFIIKNKKKLQTDLIVQYQTLSENFFLEHKNINKKKINGRSKLSKIFIEENLTKLNLNVLCNSMFLSESILIKIIKIIKDEKPEDVSRIWSRISRKQNMSEKFIENYKKELVLKNILSNKNFIRNQIKIQLKHEKYLNYKSKNQKENKVLNKEDIYKEITFF